MRALLLAVLAAGSHALRVAMHARPVLPRCGTPVCSVASPLSESIQQTTQAEDVVIFSKSWCPYCAKTKALFDDMAQPYTAIELDQRADGDELQAALLDLTQQRTVPNVFVKGQHIGGNDDSQQAARSGKLKALLEADTLTGVVVPTAGAGSSVTAAQLQAKESGKMITETEATVRKVAGVGIGLATAFSYATTGLAYTALASGIFGAVCVYRTGAEYQ